VAGAGTSTTGVKRYSLLAIEEFERLIAGLEERGAFVREAVRSFERTVHDTFDWRLYRSGSVLTLERPDPTRGAPSGVVWRSRSTGEQLGRVDTDRVPRFAWELPAGPVAERLAEIIEMRALMPLVTTRTTMATLRLLDDEQKTIARLSVDRSTVVNGPVLDPVVEVIPLRGYEQEAVWLTALLDAQVVLSPLEDDVAVLALRGAGLEPGGYSSKLRIALDPDSTALDAWVTVLRTLFASLQLNEAGMRDDLDSEFLHDYRVAVRRTRSVLAQARRIVPPELRQRFRDDFAWLGQITGPTRDLDVYLLTLPAFEAELAPERRSDLKPFVAFLDQHRRAAHAELVAALDTPRYETLVREWRAFLDDPAGHEGDPEEVPDAHRRADDVAARRTWRAYRSVVRDGRAIDDASPPEALHELRKDAKKLRYLLECFAGLYPDHDLSAVVKELKGLQDVLGEYQDCQVQTGSLQHLGQQMIEESGATAATLIALGSVVEHLETRRRRVRGAFDDRFARFDAGPVRRQVKAAYSARSRADETP
jgi:CHAD domain-containing protein